MCNSNFARLVLLRTSHNSDCISAAQVEEVRIVGIVDGAALNYAFFHSKHRSIVTNYL